MLDRATSLVARLCLILAASIAPPSAARVAIPVRRDPAPHPMPPTRRP